MPFGQHNLALTTFWGLNGDSTLGGLLFENGYLMHIVGSLVQQEVVAIPVVFRRKYEVGVHIKQGVLRLCTVLSDSV
jgi:hypothetical protein